MASKLVTFLQKRSFMHRVLLCAGFFLVLVLLGCCVMRVLRQSFAERPRPDACIQCHKDIYLQWEGSPHARAAAGEEFLFLTNNGNLEECMVCHATRTIWTGTDPLEVYEPGAGVGVDCATCHWVDGAIVAAEYSATANRIHTVTVKEGVHDDSYVCGQCHQKPYLEAESLDRLGEEITCQECHLDTLATRALKEKHGVKKLANVIHRVEAEHSMRLETLVDFPGAYSVTLDKHETTTDSVTLEFTFHNYIPHSIPSVDFGENRVSLRAVLLSPNGSRLMSKEETVDKSEPVEPLRGKQCSYSFSEVSTTPSNVVFELVHQRSEGAEEILMYSKTFSLADQHNE